MEAFLIYLIVSSCVLLIIGLFVLPTTPSLDYSNPIYVDVQHTEKEYVTKTRKVISEKIPLGAVTFKKIDFLLSQGQTTTVQWSATKRVSLVAVMKQSAYDSFYKSIVLTLGAAGASAFFSGGLSIPIITSLLIPRLPDLLKSVGSVDYFTLNSLRDNKTLNLGAGPYAVVIFGVRTRASTSMIDVSFDYQVLEDVVKHRTETHYPTKKITVWQWLFTKARASGGTQDKAIPVTQTKLFKVARAPDTQPNCIMCATRQACYSDLAERTRMICALVK